jgi:putative oxidoreductase
MNVLQKSVIVEPEGNAVAIGHTFLRVAIGLMIFYIHGVHKLLGGIAYLRDGSPWPLLKEIAEMNVPVPLASAFAATLVQFICSLFLVAGCFTRVNAALLTGTLSVAILQNLLAHRDPQLAILYVVVLITLLLAGGGRFSVDSKLSARYRATESV